MNEKDLTRIEQELDILLPSSYKKAALEEKLSKFPNSNDFYNDPDKIIATNKRLYEKGIYGQPLNKNHFVIGYDSKQRIYYFIDIHEEDGMVYLAGRTNTWKYSPENLENNQMLAYSTLDKFIAFMYMMHEMVENHHENLSNQNADELQITIADFLQKLRNSE